MAHCPFLWLEEHGEIPFPFPSVSHHCYVSSPGRPAGQQEQEKYCLTKRHTSCPLFPSPPVEEMVGAAAEPVAEGTGPAAAMASLPQEPPQRRKAWRPAAQTPAPVMPPEPGPEPVAGLAAREPSLRPTPQDVPTRASPVARVATAEPAAPPNPAAMTRPTTILPWAVGGTVTLLLLCLGTLVVVLLPRFGAGIDLTVLELPPLWPGALILVSVVSFAGAALLLGLLLWARRRDST